MGEKQLCRASGGWWCDDDDWRRVASGVVFIVHIVCHVCGGHGGDCISGGFGGCCVMTILALVVVEESSREFDRE